MEEMTLEEKYRALGLEPPAAEEEPVEEAEEEPVGAESGEDEPDAEPDGEDAEEPEDEPEDEEPEEQPKQTRSKNAERRRRREQKAEAEKAAAVQAALAAQKEEYDAELKAAFAWAGFKDGETPIETLEQMRDYRLRSELKSGKLTPELLQDAVRREMRSAEAARKPEPAGDDFARQVEAELAEIRKYDPSIRSVEDLRALDRAEAFAKEVTEHRHTFLEAYRITYADRIAAEQTRKASAAAAQSARNSAASKAHMKPVNARGAVEATVPKSFMDRAAALMPKSTPAQRREYYQKYAKSQPK